MTRRSTRPLTNLLIVSASGGLWLGCSSGGRSGGGAGPASATLGSTAPGATSAAGPGARVFLQDALPPGETAGPRTISDPVSGAPLFRMEQLWLTVTDASLAGDAPAPLTLVGDATGPTKVDLLALRDSSALLAVGPAPAGLYTGVSMTVVGAEMVGTDLASGKRVTQPLALRTTQFTAPLDPSTGPLDPTRPAILVVDWQAAVDGTLMQGATPLYRLTGTSDAFLSGVGNRIGQAATLKGQVRDVAPGTLTLDTRGCGTAVAVPPTLSTPSLAPGQGVSVGVSMPDRVGSPLVATSVIADTPPAPAPPAANPIPSPAPNPAIPARAGAPGARSGRDDLRRAPDLPARREPPRRHLRQPGPPEGPGDPDQPARVRRVPAARREHQHGGGRGDDRRAHGL